MSDENTIPDGDVSDDEILERLIAQNDDADEDEAESTPESKAEHDEEEADQPPAPRKLKVKVDGEEREVTEDELVKNFQIESAARKRLAEAAEASKSVEAEKAQIAQLRQQHMQALQQLYQQHQEPQINWEELRQNDPLQYVHERAAQLERQQQRQQAAQQHAQLFQQHEQEAYAQRAAYLEEQKAKAAEIIPEYRDPEKRAAFQKRVREHGLSIGFSAEELAQADDYRALIVLDESAKYRELMARVKGIKPAATPTAVPNAQRAPPNKAKALDRLKQTGSDDDALAAFMERSR
jgi:hypothetical protein